MKQAPTDRGGFLKGVYIEMDWNNIMTAKEASLKLGKNEKYIYLLWKNDSTLLLDGSVNKKGNTLLITRKGYDHLKRQLKNESDHDSNKDRNVVLGEMYAHTFG